MATVADANSAARSFKLPGWLPLVVLPSAVAWLGAGWPPPVLMWALAGSIFAGLKWVTLADCHDAASASLGRVLGYLLLWPGMDAQSFFASTRSITLPAVGEWLWACANLAFGVLLVFAAAGLVDRQPLLAGGLGMAGIIFTLHCGLFHLLSVLWRRAGIDARPIMNAPPAASSLSDFWGRRWNLAVRDVAHAYLFRPLARPLGLAGATMAVFVASGLVHDLVISLPAGGGYGLPTLYFVIQGAGVLFERSGPGKRLGAGRGLTGRLFCGMVVVGPVLLLFHRPFLGQVIVPMLMPITGGGGSP